MNSAIDQLVNDLAKEIDRQILEELVTLNRLRSSVLLNWTRKQIYSMYARY